MKDTFHHLGLFLRTLLLAFLAGAGTMTATAATPPPAAPEMFSLHLDKDILVIANDEGKVIARIPPETLGAAVRVEDCDFTVTFGQNPLRDLVAILTADPANPRGLSFSVNGAHMEMERSTAVKPVSITLVLSRAEETDVVADALDLGEGNKVTPLDGKTTSLDGATGSLSPASSLDQTPQASARMLPTIGMVALRLNPRTTTPF